MLRRLLSKMRPDRRKPSAVHPVTLTLYTRPDCSLCDTMKREVERARVSRPLRWVVVDIETDPELEARYGRSIPVLEIDGQVAFKGRLTADEFARKFERRVAASAGGNA